MAHHSHTRAMSTHTWNMAYGNDGIRIWALDLGVSTFLRVLLFLFVFRFPRFLDSAYSPLLRFSCCCILFRHYCPPPLPILQPLYCISFLRSFSLPCFFSSSLFFLISLNWARSRGKNIMLLGSLIHEPVCQISFFITSVFFRFFSYFPLPWISYIIPPSSTPRCLFYNLTAVLSLNLCWS